MPAAMPLRWPGAGRHDHPDPLAEATGRQVDVDRARDAFGEIAQHQVLGPVDVVTLPLAVEAHVEQQHNRS